LLNSSKARGLPGSDARVAITLANTAKTRR
jgi:hypothetical protein